MGFFLDGGEAFTQGALVTIIVSGLEFLHATSSLMFLSLSTLLELQALYPTIIIILVAIGQSRNATPAAPRNEQALPPSSIMSLSYPSMASSAISEVPNVFTHPSSVLHIDKAFERMEAGGKWGVESGTAM